MSGTITVNGLGSGLDYSTWIDELVAVKQADITAVQKKVTNTQTKEKTMSSLEDDYSNLLDSIKTFTDALSTNDVFNQKITSSSATDVTATADTTATNQSINVFVSQLATATIAQSSNNAAAYANSTTAISNVSEGAVDAGYFSLYINGTQNKIQVTSSESLGDVVNAISSTLGSAGTVSLVDGKLTISAADTTTKISIGSTSDTSNLMDVMGVEKTTTSTTGITSFTSSNAVYATNTSGTLTDTIFATDAAGDSQVKAGTFSINGVTFTISSTTSTTVTTNSTTGATTTTVTQPTTLKSLISQINSSNAGVTAYWDSAAGKLSLTSKDTGATNIDIEAGTSNFTDIMGLTSSTWNEDGSLKSTSIIDDAQTLGKNAKVKINGSSVTSASNTIDSSVSGLTGVTLKLGAASSTTTSVSVKTDTSKIETAFNSFITSLNSVIADTDDATATDGNLYGETLLNSLRNKLRTITTASINGFSLSKVGITTGDIGTSVKANTNQLTVNSDTWNSFVASGNMDQLKTFLVGDGTNEGMMNKLKTVVTNATKTTDGFFTTREASYEKQVKNYNDKIDRMNLALTSYEKQLQAKFSAMDTLISSLEKSASIFDSYFNKSSSSS